MGGDEQTLPQYAQLLRGARKARGWTQKRTADRLGCGLSSLANTENGRPVPKVFDRVPDVFPEDAPAIMLAWSQERPQSDGMPLGVLPSLGRVMTVGSGLLGDLEDRHNYIRVGTYLETVGDPSIAIGSPYLRYWLESPKRCRLERLLDQIPTLTAEVVLFKGEESDTDTDESWSRLMQVAEVFGGRVCPARPDRGTDFSYIMYEFVGDAEVRLRRLILGLQIVEYEERPFIEIISPSDEPDLITNRVLEFHREHVGSTA